GCPSLTDSDVNKYAMVQIYRNDFDLKAQGVHIFRGRCPNIHSGETALAFFWCRSQGKQLRLQSVKSFLVLWNKSTVLYHISKLCDLPFPPNSISSTFFSLSRYTLYIAHNGTPQVPEH